MASGTRMSGGAGGSRGWLETGLKTPQNSSNSREGRGWSASERKGREKWVEILVVFS